MRNPLKQNRLVQQAAAAAFVAQRIAWIAHRQKLSALLHGSEPTRYELVYEVGEV